jgi:hypothetical protein
MNYDPADDDPPDTQSRFERELLSLYRKILRRILILAAIGAHYMLLTQPIAGMRV